VTNKDQQQNEEEKPEIYSVKKDGDKFSYSRRDFLVTAAAGTTAVAIIGAGINTLKPENATGNSGTPDPEQMVKLEVDALGSLVVPLVSGIDRIWRIENRGEMTCPKSVLHLALKDDAGIQQAIDVPEIAPGKSVEIPVNLALPKQPGNYIYQWQLKIGDGAARLNEFPLSVTGAALAESPHPYYSDTDQTWTIQNPDTSAASTHIHFARLEVEDTFDEVTIKDGSGNVIQTLTGAYPQGLWSSKVNGNVAQVQLTSDSSVEEWGFLVDEVRTSLFLNYLPIVSKPAPIPTSYVVCTCNTVEVCTCNLVCVCEAVCSCDTFCSCDGYCSCDRVCTCDRVCSCVGAHYWHPN
jgi:hypothetical protein